MISIRTALLLDREHTERLLRYMQEYRGCMLSTMPPTSGRNVTLRLIQALQGKLQGFCVQHPLKLQLSLAKEEVLAFQSMTRCLLIRYSEQADSLSRTMIVNDLGWLSITLKQTLM